MRSTDGFFGHLIGNFDWSCAHTSGGSKGNFIQFFRKSGQFVCWHPPPEGWRPLLRGILDPPLHTRESHTATGHGTMGPAYNEFGYNDQPSVTSRFLCVKFIDCNVQCSKIRLQRGVSISSFYSL